MTQLSSNSSASPAPPAPPAPAPSAPQLDYGLSPPRRRKQLIRAAVLVAGVMLGLAGYKWGPIVWQQGPILFWQRQCMHYSASPEQVVYEEDPSEVARLLTGERYTRYRLMRGSFTDPTPVKTLAAAARMPTRWTRLIELAPPKFPLPGRMSGAILFLHERTSPSGHRRLVCVRYYAENYSFTPQFVPGYNCEVQVITPATWTAAPASTSSSGAFVGWNLQVNLPVPANFPRSPPRVRIYAGQVDPDDDARFTVRYEMWGQSDVLDGRLGDDDTVSLTPRQAPQDN